MTSTKIAVLCLAPLAVLASVGFLMVRQGALADNALRAARDVSSLKQSVRELAEKRGPTTVIVEAARAEPAASASAGAAAPAAPAASAEPAAELTPEEQHYRTEVLNQAQTDLVSQAMDREAADPRWSPGATELIRSTYAGEEFAGVTLDASCKSTLCKISLTSADPLRGEQALRKIVQKSPWPTTGIAAYDRENQKGFVYLSREGTELPRVDPTTIAF